MQNDNHYFYQEEKPFIKKIKYKVLLFILKLTKSVKIINSLQTQWVNEVCKNGGDILEIGFGGGVIASYIQKHNIKTHTIIESDNFFFSELLKWGKNKSNLIKIKGKWQDSIPPNKKYDGILIDLWNNDEDYKYKKLLFSTIKKHVKSGTVLVCVTTNILDKKLYIKDGNKYEEIKHHKSKIKWYNLISKNILKKSKKGMIGEWVDKIEKITYK